MTLTLIIRASFRLAAGDAYDLPPKPATMQQLRKK
jgi:hypothetical protein